MHAIEGMGVGRKGSEAGLGLVLVGDPPSKFEEEFREAKAALLAWQSKHGGNCGAVMLTITAPPERHEGITEFLDRVYREETELAPLLQRIQVNVAILNLRGKPTCQYKLGREQPMLRAGEKPWWKFW